MAVAVKTPPGARSSGTLASPAIISLVGVVYLLASLASLREDVGAKRALLASAKERAETLPHRERNLRLVHRLGDLLLDAHEQWLDEVEQELSQP